jgi:dsRNA-specific ribonuclease
MDFKIDEEGRAHERIYTATIEFEVEGKGIISASGRGSKKREAERDASLKACIQLDR